ncbi:hypothetical protein [uncultured Draconibacterium sp.]|uniref:hypothetical protein n=1 Tax=uncultured Draconibacterium sp. TaxID=1573823 RepID=UPI0029C7A159|nr:hypothetical protein [uncultured Draconibacterium sp.]
MDTYDIEVVIKGLKKNDKEKIIRIFAPLINNLIISGDSYENISSTINECGIEFDGEQIKKIVTQKDSQKINLNSFSTEIINAIQDIENRIIFNNSSSVEYIKRAQSSVFKNYNSSSKSSLTIRQVALNLCEKYSSRIEMYHNYKDIRFGSKSSISLDIQMSGSFVSIWLDSTDAIQLIGYSWQNNINSFLDIIAFKVSDFHEIQVAILPPPYDALHVKILGE